MNEKRKPNIIQNIFTEALIGSEESSNKLGDQKKFRRELKLIIKKRRVFLSGAALIIASFVGSILNYIFNAYLGRILDFKDFALIGLIGGFLSFATILFGAFSASTTYRSSFLIGKYGSSAGYSFWAYSRRKVVSFSIIIVVLWLLLTPFLMKFFNTYNYYVFIFFSIVLLVGFVNSIDRGFLSSKLMFGSIAMTSILDPVIKLSVIILLVFLGLKIWAFTAVSVSALLVFIFSWILVVKQVQKEKDTAPTSVVQRSSNKFFFLALLTGFSSSAVFTFDILLANHFLTPTEAGKYALLSLVGKMIYFLGNLTQPFLIPLISRDKGRSRNSFKTLNVLLLVTFALSLIGFVSLGIFGYFTVPMLYGSKAISIVPFLILFTFGMTCYTISRVIVSYYLVLEFYTITIVTTLLVLLMIWLILIYHNSAQAIAMVMTFIFVMNLSLTAILHLGIKYVRRFENRISGLVKAYGLMEIKITKLKRVILSNQL